MTFVRPSSWGPYWARASSVSASVWVAADSELLSQIGVAMDPGSSRITGMSHGRSS